MYNKPFKWMTSAIVACLMLVPVANAQSVNKSITVDAGEKSEGQSTVNGSIRVGDGATIDGSLETVNGAIRIGNEVSVKDVGTVNGSIKAGDKLTAGSLQTVNGEIQVGAGGAIDGDIETVNGRIQLASGTRVADDVETVNGELDFAGALIRGDVTGMNGDVTLKDGAVIEGDLKIEKPGGWFNKNKRKPKVTIGPGSAVKGKIILDREVELYISETAEVGGVSGEMGLNDAVRFSGERP
jgi:DUF4097 and DUF4098 domain-containing protein YvlB